MSQNLALDVFHRLMDQVMSIESIVDEVDRDNLVATSSLRRSAYVLAVAAIDAYFHELAVERLHTAAQSGRTSAVKVANYLSNVSADEVSDEAGSFHIRHRLSYKTLVSPENIDKVITAWGGDASKCWLDHSIKLGSRPDRERRQLSLVYDRRNMIAHEGDWDFVQFDLRDMPAAHLKDCIDVVTRIAQGFDPIL